MMALMPRKAIYLFDVYLLATLFDRATFALRFGEVGRGVSPKMLGFVAAKSLTQDVLCSRRR
jgi:hypothetical protein